MEPSPSDAPGELPPWRRARPGFFVLALLASLPVLGLGLQELAYPRVAVLCLHGFGDRPSDPWTLDAAALEPLLDQVAASGRVVVLSDALEPGARPAFAPPGVILSFDDGRASHGGLVPEALARRGWRGLFFVQSDPAVRELPDAAIRALVGAGHEIGSHSRTHTPFLHGKGEAPAAYLARLARETAGSRAELAALTGRPVRTFAYPRGDHPPEAVAAVRAAGYAFAFTTVYDHHRPGEDALRVPRLLLDRATSARVVDEYLAGPRRDAWLQAGVGAAVFLASLLGLARARRAGAPVSPGGGG